MFLFRSPSLIARRGSLPRRGFTLIEMILVLSVGSMVTLLSFQGMKRQTESNQAQIAGQQLKIVGNAVNNYISNRYTQISQLTTVPDNVGNTADPGPRTCNAGTGLCTITVKTLVNEGLLPGNYSNNNSFSPTGGVAYTIELKVTGTSPNWQVNGVVTTVPWTVGGVVRYDLLGQAMTAAGPDSGMTRASANELDGYNGIWNEVSANYSNIGQLGQLGFRAGYGSALYSVYLRRDGTLPMTGDLNLSDGTAHNITNAANVSGNGRFTSNQAYTNYVNLAGNLDMTGAATVNGALNVNGNASVAGTVATNGFQDYGNATINGSAAVGGTVTAGRVVVPTGNNVQVGNTYYYGDGTNSAVRQAGTFFVQNQAGSAAAPINTGNATVNGTVSANTGVFAAGGNVLIGNSIYYGDAANSAIYQNGSLFIQHPGGAAADIALVGNVNSSANVSANYLIPKGGAAVNGGCAPNGTIGTDGARPLFCSNGVWRPASSAFQIGYSTVYQGNNNAEAYCPAGWSTVSGGAACQGGDLESSFWAPDGGWYAKCNGGAVEVWAGCMALN